MQPIAEKVNDLDQLRNAALAACTAYTVKSVRNERFDLLNQVQAVSDTMPTLTKMVAVKLADRAKEKVRSAAMTSICGKIAAQGELATDAMISYAKTQKKGANYNMMCSF